ncbi:MAG: hemerythrin domain-containing protein [Amylibacter sp.]|nr:hemerythrin domain-containing protein [Amylibacter sp.]
MKWKEEFATGIAEIDRQHKTLFEASEDFREVLERGCSSGTYDGFLEFLVMYVETHFGYEEECMHAAQCPIACTNKKEHALFIKLVDKEVQFFQQRGLDIQRAFRLLDTLDSWLASHIVRIDVQLRVA